MSEQAQAVTPSPAEEAKLPISIPDNDAAVPEEASANDTTPEAPAPKPDRVASKFAALAREEKRIRMEKAAMQKEREELNAQKIKWQRVSENPAEALPEFGIDAEEHIRRFINGKPTPEFMVQKLEEKVNSLERSLAQEKQRVIEEQARAQELQTIESAKAEFVAFVEGSPDKYPLLCEYSPGIIGASALRAVEHLTNELGRYPTQQEVASRLEEEAQASYKIREERRKKFQKPEKAEGKTISTKTISSKDTSQKSTIPRAKTQEEIDEESKKIIEAMWAKP